MVDTITKKTPRKAASKKSGTTARSKKSTSAKAKSGSKKASTAKSKVTTRKTATGATPESYSILEQQASALRGGISGLTSTAMEFANKTRGRASKNKEQTPATKKRKNAITRSAEQLQMMADAGESLRDLREVAGLNLADISKALKLRDKSFLEAVEGGKEALSLEMIMRLASLYARNDPVPFVLNHIRTYRPKLWEVIEEWGLDALPAKIERERHFLNIYKRRDAARQLSSEGFDKVLAFTQDAFEMALHFVAELEEIDNSVNPEFENSDDGQDTDS